MRIESLFLPISMRVSVTSPTLDRLAYLGMPAHAKVQGLVALVVAHLVARSVESNVPSFNANPARGKSYRGRQSNASAVGKAELSM